MKKLIELIIKLKIYILIAILIITIFFSYQLKNIQIDPNIAKYLPTNDSTIKLFDYIGETFNGNMVAMIVLESDSIFTNEFLIKLSQITDSISMFKEVNNVMSLTNITDIKEIKGDIVIEKLINPEELPFDENKMRILKQYIDTNNTYKGSIISNNMKYTMIIIKYEPLSGNNENEISNDIKRIVMNSGINAKVYFGGTPFLVADIADNIIRDLKILAPIVSVLMIIILLLTFKSLLGVILPLVSVIISTIWTIGLMGFLNKPLTMISDIIPVLLMAVGSAYSIHIISKFYEIKHKDRENFKKAFAEILPPVFFAAFTTIIGFISFIFGSYLIMIKDFGIFIAIGVLISFIISVTFVPTILLMFINTNKKRNKTQFSLKFLSDFIVQKNKIIIIISILLIIISFFGMFHIERKANIVNYFDKNSYTQKTERIIQKQFGGSTTLQILCKGDMDSYETLKKINKIDDFLKKHNDIHNIMSLSTIMKKMNKLIENKDILPNNDEKIANLWFLLEGEDFINDIVNDDHTEGLIIATFENGFNTQLSKNTIKEINEFLNSINNEQFSAQLSGMLTIYEKIDHSIVTSQIQSIIIALIFIFILLLIVLKSLKDGVLAMIPIVFALIIILGFMGFAKIPLDIATALIGGVSIGIGIDYTFHFNERYRIELKRKNNIEALKTTISTSGSAIFINMLTVITGFIILVFAKLIPLRRFGILISITMFASAFGAVFILPAIYSLKRGGKNEKNN